MIARSDAAGLERAIKSARPHVDRVIVGVDGRSDAETVIMAGQLADEVWGFEKGDIGLSDEAWAVDKINFAAARNLGRARVKTPWTLVIDSDEFLECVVDLRAFVKSLPDIVGAIALPVHLGDSITLDHHRIARSEFCWRAHTHNQLVIPEKWQYTVYQGAHVFQQLDLRSKAEQERRRKQRDAANEDLKVDAKAGDLAALYHVAKHATHAGSEDHVALVNEFRLSTEVHGLAAKERRQLAILVACGFFDKKDYATAETWAVKALMDGPSLEAFYLLGDIADLRGRKKDALAWHEIACITLPSEEFGIPELVTKRFLRRDELRR